VSLLERKITARDIKGEAGIRKWQICLKRLFECHSLSCSSKKCERRISLHGETLALD
jgi:hypothetical protein